MNKICVIAKNKKTYFINRLIEEVGEVLLFDPWSDLIIPTAETYLCRTTGVYKSDLDLLMIKTLGRVVNSHDSLKRFRRKITQYQWFEENDIPCLPWISLKDSDAITAEKFTVLYPEVIVKPDVGQGGWGIEVIRRDNLKTWMKKHDSDYLLQPFIKDAIELRCFFVQGSPLTVLERKARSGVTANFKKLGEASVSKIPDEYKEGIDRLIRLSGALYGAIDLLIDQDRLYILELNTVPGIEQLEKVSGQNMMRIILKGLNN